MDYVEVIRNILNENYKLVVPVQVVKELEKLRNDKFKRVSGKDKRAADLALQLLDLNKVKKINIKGKTVDEGIINLSREEDKNIVCTLDSEMRKILGRVILVNKGKRLMITK